MARPRSTPPWPRRARCSRPWG